MNRQRMVDALNSLEVIDYSASGGELEYVTAENSDENRNILLQAGFTERDLDEATCHDELDDIDLTHLAVNRAHIYCWTKDDGFIEEDAFNERKKEWGELDE